MALGRFPRRTILTELGDLRPASDLSGRHAVRLNSGPECRQDLARRLLNAGCEVNTEGTDWLSAGAFEAPPRVIVEIDDQSSPPVEDPLVREAEALRRDLEGQRGMVTWTVGTVYNGLLDRADMHDLPRANPRGRTGAENLMKEPTRCTMLADEMRAHLGQLIARLT